MSILSKSDYAKYCIAQLELIRHQLRHLAKTTQALNPHVSESLRVYADELKDHRELLEEHIAEGFDIGK